ncbi:hypothetical protein [Sphingobacterium athyrii]|uniref:Uncharacterized protein n=1 Tax=Sphingobacterium athyrii TaxID=2152717 RepID=A0A363NQU4_9SPHI|nr:hypothetical protein [Sphingobacterium athyrii]PUV23139.1 hypothetical protein DCO56_19710 [Sphingobacterium athyrii]
MHSKGMAQLLAPFFITIVLLIASYLLSIVIGFVLYLLKAEQDFIHSITRVFQVSIFNFDKEGTIAFWIIDALIIIFIEMRISAEDEWD